MPKKDLELNDQVWIANSDNYTTIKGIVTEVITDLTQYAYIPAEVEFVYKVTLSDNSKMGFCYPWTFDSSYSIAPFSSLVSATGFLVDIIDNHMGWYNHRLKNLQSIRDRLFAELSAETENHQQLELELGL